MSKIVNLYILNVCGLLHLVYLHTAVNNMKEEGVVTPEVLSCSDTLVLVHLTISCVCICVYARCDSQMRRELFLQNVQESVQS